MTEATVPPRFPAPINDPDRQWAHQFLRVLQTEFGKVVQPVGQKYLPTNFSPIRTMSASGGTSAVGGVGTVTVMIGGSITVGVTGVGGATSTPDYLDDIVATLINDLRVRGWVG